MTTEREIDLAEFLRDTRLAGCEHSTTPYPEACSPCTRDDILASPWLTAHTATKVIAAVEAAAVRVEAMRTAPPRDTFALMIRVPAAFVERAWACWNLGVVDAARAVRGDS